MQGKAKYNYTFVTLPRTLPIADTLVNRAAFFLFFVHLWIKYSRNKNDNWLYVPFYRVQVFWDNLGKDVVSRVTFASVKFYHEHWHLSLKIFKKKLGTGEMGRELRCGDSNLHGQGESSDSQPTKLRKFHPQHRHHISFSLFSQQLPGATFRS